MNSRLTLLALHVLLIAVLGSGSAAISMTPSTAYAQDLEPGTVFRDCPKCPEVVVVPAGTFTMGSSVGAKKRELPYTDVTIAKPFAIGRYEVTWEEFEACNADGGCSLKPVDHRNWGTGRRPIQTVKFNQILEYTAWLSAITGKRYRLPSEAEWEYAARANTKTEYWWGDKMRIGEVNCRGCGTEYSSYKSAPVGSFKPNPWGLYDVHANVLELVADCWNTSHEGAKPDGSARTDGNCQSRVAKGGGWYYLSKVARAASRVRNDTRIGSDKFGFRVVRELD